MARNSENAPSEPSGRRRTPPEGGSRLRQHFRDSIRDALTGVDVDALQGRHTLPVPKDVSLLTREAVTDLEAELAALRAERAELERRAGAREAVVAVVEAPAEAPAAAAEAPVELEPAREASQREGRWPWRRGRPAAVEVEEAAAALPAGRNGNGAAAPAVAGSTVAWSLARAMEPVPEVAPAPDLTAPSGVEQQPEATVAPPAHAEEVAPAATVAPAPDLTAPSAVEQPEAPSPAPLAEPEPLPEALPPAPPAEPPLAIAPPTAPDSQPGLATAPPKRRRQPSPRRTPLSDAELESVVAPLLAELANLRAEVRQLRGDPEEPHHLRVAPNRQMAKLAVGLLLGFALIVVALAVVLKA